MNKRIRLGLVFIIILITCTTCDTYFNPREAAGLDMYTYIYWSEGQSVFMIELPQNSNSPPESDKQHIFTPPEADYEVRALALGQNGNTLYVAISQVEMASPPYNNRIVRVDLNSGASDTIHDEGKFDSLDILLNNNPINSMVLQSGQDLFIAVADRIVRAPPDNMGSLNYFGDSMPNSVTDITLDEQNNRILCIRDSNANMLKIYDTFSGALANEYMLGNDDFGNPLVPNAGQIAVSHDGNELFYFGGQYESEATGSILLRASLDQTQAIPAPTHYLVDDIFIEGSQYRIMDIDLDSKNRMIYFTEGGIGSEGIYVVPFDPPYSGGMPQPNNNVPTKIWDIQMEPRAIAISK